MTGASPTRTWWASLTARRLWRTSHDGSQGRTCVRIKGIRCQHSPLRLHSITPRAGFVRPPGAFAQTEGFRVCTHEWNGNSKSSFRLRSARRQRLCGATSEAFAWPNALTLRPVPRSTTPSRVLLRHRSTSQRCHLLFSAVCTTSIRTSPSRVIRSFKPRSMQVTFVR